jgi:hypothetical protein
MGNLTMLRERLQSLKKNQTSSQIDALSAGMEDEDRVLLEQLAYFSELTYSNKYGENYAALKHDLDKQLEEHHLKVLEQKIATYDAEELITVLEVSKSAAKPPSFDAHIVNRFCRLVERHLEQSAPGFEKRGDEVQVTMRHLETHSFAKLVHHIFFLREQLTDDQLLKMKPLIDQ